MAQKALIVDDDKMIRRIVSEVLGIAGLEVDQREHAKDLLKYVRSSEPDIILLDYHMPDIDGLAALRDLRKHLVTTPVVMMTADTNQKVLLQCFRDGADDFIEKPFDYDLLTVIITRTLERKGISLKDAVFRLLQYARHKDDCDQDSHDGCTCSLTSTIAAAVDATRNVFPD
ncbi:MAG: response regulator [Rhodospirillaceae bacterium]|mgnify:CR=1 FL=1|jgi:two-component system, CitB family, response regulator DctR|nr:response regulator [Rhodospirillaceae bacterium]MBT4218947.1 response regulator [Rhodospirillaceae bacterium]MBT4464986.1 response regulator [Rhodospirillaceae bacterium]MBT5014499.1 response regulator [Rhodospirillaceae bacterium]MBT5308671.1 response regulator [Rhodospirillaceae bacterium]